ncbi:MAG: hypothetical protein GX458_22295 [Phyllobacteriaceae bacterium]|nr:hypothetical protein [Phyllobacteriaceae bacterium]
MRSIPAMRAWDAFAVTAPFGGVTERASTSFSMELAVAVGAGFQIMKVLPTKA